MKQSIETMFALADRKVESFDFTLKKVRGKQTGNEFYAVSGESIINGEKFEKSVLTIGCPAAAIEKIVKALLAFKATASTKVVAPGIVESAAEVAPGIKLAEAIGFKLKSIDENVVAPGIRLAEEELEEVDEDEYDDDEDDDDEDDEDEDFDDDDEDEDDDDDYDECEGCHGCDNLDEEPSFKLRPVETPVTNTVSTAGPKKCPYCNGMVAPNFAFCPHCGGQQ